ncbi:sulfate transporter family-domain-containing protein [Dichomitus squalens]|uniref:Sulfate transporter family-domain-containing protein n=1 Tax=Dichomitus squalens TaxID=114155 RepID=A0A4Q9NYG2_9APHY|nr:sulfate transporter family-domain-containing protein [Dichomitus squalens]TBU45352.1 sulfate transporter family-domain-containing protein [Dichomitus squalens]TBU60223.1 sulfate transporter family-domain-containing protein [Dichomitus squalens]
MWGSLSVVREQSVTSEGASHAREEPDRETSDENVPLLSDLEANHQTYHTNGDSRPEAVGKRSARGAVKDFTVRIARESAPVAKDALRSIPAAILGTLLNILDGVSYGMIIFPATGVFEHLGGVGVSMFFVSAIVSQLIYSAGASGFAGANGSMMIEVVPFFHLIANGIAEEIGEENPRAVMATTMVAFAFSSILTGLTFFLLGALRLGTLIGFFPRHILVGCIGGVGVFLVITGLTVSTRMSDDDFSLSLETFKYLVLNVGNLVLWLPAFGLAVLLRFITHKWDHQLIFPIYFCIIPAVFYIVVAAARINLGDLREAGWLFDNGTSREPWWYFYTLFDFGAMNWGAFWSVMPTQLALLFFNILHPPLNVPALAVSLNHDANTDKELVAHGYSNLLAGLIGTVPNYLVYVNTLLFYRVGGDTRVSGFMLAGATTLLLLVGTGPIAFIPVMVVGALIFVLGIDLVKEALWDTRHRVSRMEYITIISIMIVMTVWDFVTGVLFGIIVSCFFFVVQSSQRQSIRALYSGDSVVSTVRRPGAHRAYLRDVSKQTTVMRLQGFLFFGTITHVEDAIRALLDEPAWQRTPIRFLVLDLALVAGVDMSAAEAFVRVQRLLASKRVVLVLCGFQVDSGVGRALSNVGLFEMAGVELFETFSGAIEWTENTYLRAWFTTQKTEVLPVTLPGRQDDAIPFYGSVIDSPRRAALVGAGWRTIARDHSPPDDLPAPEPFNTLVRAFSPYEQIDQETFAPLIPYLKRMSVPESTVIWEQDQPPDGLYIVESGILRATYNFADPTPPMIETMVPGTIAGELSTLSGLERNATCVVERSAVLWKLSNENLARLEQEQPELARVFTRLILKVAKLDYDMLITALATRQ